MKCIKGFAVALVLLAHAGLASASVGFYLADISFPRDSRCTDTCAENGFADILGMCISVVGTSYEVGTLGPTCDATTDSCCSVPALDTFGNPVAVFVDEFLCVCRDFTSDIDTNDCVTDCPIGTLPFVAADPLGAICFTGTASETSYGLVSQVDGSCIYVSSAGLILEVTETLNYNCMCISTSLAGQTTYLTNVFGPFLPLYSGPCTSVRTHPLTDNTVAAVARTANNLDLFVTGSDGVVYTQGWTPSLGWSGTNQLWYDLGGPSASVSFPAAAPISVVNRTYNTMDLFVIGNDGVVYTSGWSATFGWSTQTNGFNNPWINLGGYFPAVTPVAVVARTINNIDLFIVGSDGAVYTSGWTPIGGWSGINNNWKYLGGCFPVGAPVSVVARTANVMDLFVVGSDGAVYTTGWSISSGWSGTWSTLGDGFPSGTPVSVVSRTANNIDLFVIGIDGVVYNKAWSLSSGWSALWFSIGGTFPVGQKVSAVSRMPSQIDLFLTGEDGALYTSYWSAAVGVWSGAPPLGNWQNLGGFFPIGTPVAAVARQASNLDAFVVGPNNVVYTYYWSNSQKVWLHSILSAP